MAKDTLSKYLKSGLPYKEFRFILRITQLMPRRIPDYPDAYAEWNAISSFGSIISVVATVLFGYIIYDLFINGKPVANSPWEMPEYFESMIDLRENREIVSEAAESLEWAMKSPAEYHAFEEVPTEFEK
ncbi:hypothetical protein Clacol_010475 [Clathrus columnatus]|uniref:Uncharacterized protein n=1 Tax=Clathrus columnatus TaxID=1419009 RepID=A0AAV5AWB5_9AGAM|nr:hypothetical protein Clacol_010475 [Clathrus columnatus]